MGLHLALRAAHVCFSSCNEDQNLQVSGHGTWKSPLWISGEPLPQMKKFKCLGVMTNWEKDLGHTKDMLERLKTSAGPQRHPGAPCESCEWGEQCLRVFAKAASSATQISGWRYKIEKQHSYLLFLVRVELRSVCPTKATVHGFCFIATHEPGL